MEFVLTNSVVDNKAHTAFTMDLIRQESRSIYSSPTLRPGLQYLTPQALKGTVA